MPLPNYRHTRSSVFGYFPPGVKWLLIINSAVFVLWFLGGRSFQSHVNTLFALIAEAVIRNLYVWQIFTYMFLHGGVAHLLFNMLTLWFFGVQLEQDWGTRRFLKYYFYCGMAAAACVLAVNVAVGDWMVPTLGSSGAIFGVLVAFGVLHPDQTVLMNFLFPVKAKYMVMIYAGIELLLTFGPNTGASTVAHLGGMAFGYLYIKRRLPAFHLPDMQYRYKQWRLARSKRKFQVYLKKQDRRGGPWVN
jgi:membrane associated rhomboid family serine protease